MKTYRNFYTLVATILLWITQCNTKPQMRRLNNMIRHYEPVTYDHTTFHKDHHITKRSTDSTLKLDIHAFGKHFPLRLKRDTKSVAHDLKVELSGTREAKHWAADNAYTGYVKGVAKSKVFGVVHSTGVFEGAIRTLDTVYKIEPAFKHNLTDTDIKEEFHSIIYRNEDVEYDKVKAPSMCESDNLHKKMKDELLFNNKQEVDMEDDPEDVWHNYEGAGKYQAPREKPSKKKAHSRKKRAIDPTKTQCTLYVQIDHKYAEYWGSDETIVNEITLHVQAVNDIYEPIDFDRDGTAGGINYIVKRIKIWSLDEEGYKFPDNYDVVTYLETFSRDEDFDDFCLAYIFTYRDFDGGTLGLAWTGDSSAAGGTCERMAVFSGVQKALNAGLVSILNYGEVQPHLISFVTFAHELGHNNGSPHDEDDTDCAPGGDQGNYIMYPKATDGHKPNNQQFSSCSIADMHPILLEKARDVDDGCFQVPVTTICGNGVVEDGEECDCGYDTDCTDTCCNPQVSSGAAVGNSSTPCTLAAGAACSPSQGSCCAEDCTIVAANDSLVCRTAAGCKAQAVCDGGNTTCPASTVQDDGYQCSATKVCQDGECTGSLCLIYNMEECQCEPETAGDFKDEILCQLCCTHNTTLDNSTCTSSFSLADIPDTDADPGSACMDYQGYCDVFHVCRPVVPDGILTSIFSASNVVNWLKANWYFPLVGAVVLIIGMAVMIKFCTPKKKSDKDKKKKDKDKKKVGPSPKKGPGPRRDQALTPPKAKPYKVYNNGNGYPGGQFPPGGPPGGPQGYGNGYPLGPGGYPQVPGNYPQGGGVGGFPQGGGYGPPGVAPGYPGGGGMYGGGF